MGAFHALEVHPRDFGFRATLDAVERALTELRRPLDLVLLHWPACHEAYCGRDLNMAPAGDWLD